MGKEQLGRSRGNGSQGTGEDLDKMVQMLNEQHFICIENIEMETIEIEEEHSFYVK